MKTLVLNEVVLSRIVGGANPATVDEVVSFDPISGLYYFSDVGATTGRFDHLSGSTAWSPSVVVVNGEKRLIAYDENGLNSATGDYAAFTSARPSSTTEKLILV